VCGGSRVLPIARDIGGRVGQIARAFRGGNDQRDAAVDRHVAIEQAQRLGDPARVEVVIARHRFLEEKCARIAIRVAAAIERERGQRLAGRTIAMHVALPCERVRLHDRAATVRREKLRVAGGAWRSAVAGATGGGPRRGR